MKRLLYLLTLASAACGSSSGPPAVPISWSFSDYSPPGNPSATYPAATCVEPSSFVYVVTTYGGSALSCRWACGSWPHVEDGELLVDIVYAPPTWDATVHRLGDCR
jgi:hypothetical protein